MSARSTASYIANKNNISWRGSYYSIKITIRSSVYNDNTLNYTYYDSYTSVEANRYNGIDPSGSATVPNYSPNGTGSMCVVSRLANNTLLYGSSTYFYETYYQYKNRVIFSSVRHLTVTAYDISQITTSFLYWTYYNSSIKWNW